MPTTKTVTEDLQEQVLDTIRKSQEAIVEALRGWSEAVEPFVPKRAWPLAEQLPSPAELVDSVYDFTGELLQAQRQFLHSALEATAPVTDRVKQQAAKTARSAS